MEADHLLLVEAVMTTSNATHRGKILTGEVVVGLLLVLLLVVGAVLGQRERIDRNIVG